MLKSSSYLGWEGKGNEHEERFRKKYILFDFLKDPESSGPPDILSRPAMSNAYYICHNVQVIEPRRSQMSWSNVFPGPHVLQRLLLGRSSQRKGKEKEKMILFDILNDTKNIVSQNMESSNKTTWNKPNLYLKYFALSRHFLFHCVSRT